MPLSEIHITASNNTPEYHFSPGGVIKIKGRWLMRSKDELPEQLMPWIKEYQNNPSEITYIIVAFEYLNSLSTLILVSFIRELSRVILKMKKYAVKWYYEEEDDDILERGKYISSVCNFPINFIATHDIKNCC